MSIGILRVEDLIRSQSTATSTDVAQPIEVGRYTKTSCGVSYDASGLRIFRSPPLGGNLSEGLDTFIQKPEAVPGVDRVGAAVILDSAAHYGIDTDRVSFVSYRNNLNKIMATPYACNEAWEVAVDRIGARTIHLHVTVLQPQQQATGIRANPRHREMSYWGYKFEQLCTLGATNAAVDNTSEYCGLFRCRIGENRLLLAAEIDCQEIDDSASNDRAPDRGACVNRGEGSRNGGYVELKTARLIQDERQERSFLRHKMLKIWIQSFIVGVPRVVVGFRDDDGFLRKTVSYDTLKIPRLVRGQRGQWDPHVCLGFSAKVLDWVRGLVFRRPWRSQGVTEARNYSLKYDPTAKTISLSEVSVEPCSATPSRNSTSSLLDGPAKRARKE